jgi:WD40 repeat protein
LLDARTFEPQPEVWPIDAALLIRSDSFWHSRIACSAEDGTLRVLEIVDGALREHSRSAGGIGVLTTPGWSPDGRLIAVGSMSGRTRIWEAESGALRGDFAGEQATVSGMLFLRDSESVLVCDVTGHHRVWPAGRSAPGLLRAHASFVYPVVISQDGGMLLTGGLDGLVGQSGGLKLWDARTGVLLAEYGRTDETFQTAGLTPDGRHAVVGIVNEYSGPTNVIDLMTGAVVATCQATPKRAQAMSTVVHPDGARVISTFLRGEACVWELRTGRVLWQTDLHPLLDPAWRPPAPPLSRATGACLRSPTSRRESDW